MWVLRRGQAVGRGALDASAAVTYQGPGDIVSGALFWGSPARAYSASFAAGGTAVLNLVDQAGANPITVNILSTGFVDVTSITNWVAANSVSTIKVSQLYDQTGNARHATQATLANMPTLTLSAINGLPALEGNGSFRLDTPTITQSQPFSVSGVIKRTGSTSTAMHAMGAGSGGAITFGFNSASGQGRVGGSSLVNFAGLTEGSFNAMTAAHNGASSAYNFNGTDVTGQAFGAGTFSGNAFRILDSGVGVAPLTGQVMEAGVWPSFISPTDRGLINTNQHGSNGYNF